MFHPFQVEQFLSDHEQLARYNFSESGVHPMTLGELMTYAGVDDTFLREISLNYPEVNGDIELRERIAGLYDHADADNVLVTVGASEANHLVTATLLEDGDEVVALLPTYQQLPGNAQNRGLQVRTVPLVEDEGWALDVERLEDVVSNKTRVIALVNPNNPTGKIFTDGELQAVISAADKVGAWIVADEVYAGTERESNEITQSLWNRYDRVVAINSMSKAYGLPGLRLGWLVAPSEQVPALWRRHEYATISATMLANELAKVVLHDDVRPKIVERSRQLIRRGFDTLRDSLAERPEVFSVVPPQASAMSFVRYNLNVDSQTLVRELLDRHGMLVIPGNCFGLEHHFRFSSALPDDYLRAGLSCLHAVVDDWR